MKYLLIALAVTLGGCVTANQSYVHSNFDSSAQAELSAWNEAQKLSDEKCGKFGKDNPLPRDQAVEVATCFSKIVRTVVMPKSISAQAVNEYLLEYQEIGINYKKGKLDRDEVGLESQKAWSRYTAKIDSLYNNSMAQAYQADVQAAQSRQQAIQNMNSQIQNMNNSNDMKTTNCRLSGNTMSCTEF